MAALRQKTHILSRSPWTIRSQGEPPQQCIKTQCRAIRGAILLLDLHSDGFSDKQREQASRRLGIDLVLFIRGSQRIRDGPGIKKWAKEGAKVLEKLPAIISTISGLLALGTDLGYWGPTLA